MAVELHKEALERVIQPKDLLAAGLIDTPSNRAFLSLSASSVVQSDFSGLVIRPFPVKEKIAYSILSVPHSIVLNQLNRIIRISTGLRPSDRDTIVRRLVTILSEGVPHRLYKFDIKEFYDSIDKLLLADEILVDKRIPRSSVSVLAKYLNELHNRGIQGLPRGIPLSATLAEYSLRHFDNYLSRHPQIYFYARFVDDIVVVTGGHESPRPFTRQLRRNLPFALNFNTAKSRLLDIPTQVRSNGQGIVGAFDYLGYNISVHETARVNRRLARAIEVTIAPKKIKRLKTRVCRSVLDFLETRDHQTLVRRLQLLTGNYNVRDFSTGQVRNVGLYCNYRHANQTDCLLELDAFLRAILIGQHSRLARRLAATISHSQRQSLLCFSFLDSFKNKTFYNFNPQELRSLKEWLARCLNFACNAATSIRVTQSARCLPIPVQRTSQSYSQTMVVTTI